MAVLSFKKMKKPSVAIMMIYVFLAVAVFTMLVPYYWMLITSFKPQEEIQTYPPKFYIKNPTLQPYIDLFNLIPMGRYLLNPILCTIHPSLIIMHGISLVFNMFTCLSGYICLSDGHRTKHLKVLYPPIDCYYSLPSLCLE